MFGICAFNLVAIRAHDSDKSEMVTQLLFGDTYSVLAENEKWIQIEISDDCYRGWMDKKLHYPITETFFEKTRQIENHFCAEVVGYLEVGSVTQPIFFGSYLPLFDGNYVYLDNKRFLFKGKTNKVKKAMSSKDILHTALSFTGSPYLWGGKSHAGIDCSGFTQMVFRSCGYTLMRDAYQQVSMGTHVEKIEEAKSGDLAFFSNDIGRITHVGILASNHEIIHAHGKVRIDKINSIGIINGESGLYSHKLNGIRRIMG